jgi:hypothetical protein
MAAGNFRMWVLENGLVGKVGHHFNNSIGLQAACRERGIESRFIVHHRATADVIEMFGAQARFPFTPYFQASSDPLSGEIECLFIQGSGFAGVFQALAADGLGASDVVFVPTTTQVELFGCAMALNSLPKDRRPKVILNFMMENFLGPDSSRWGANAPLYRFAARFLARAGGTCLLTANGARMARRLTELLGFDVHCYPMPKHYPESSSQEPRAARPPSAPLSIAVLGHVRADKSLGLLPDLVARHPGLHFLIQMAGANPAHPWHREKANVSLPGNVEAFHDTLSEADYYALLSRSDVVLHLHDAAKIPLRASGVYSEAVAAAKVVVVPAKTWMEDHLAEGNGAGVVYAERSVAAISQALEDCARNIAALQARASLCAPRWRENQCIGAFLDKARSALALPSRRAAGDQ